VFSLAVPLLSSSAEATLQLTLNVCHREALKEQQEQKSSDLYIF